ncbi:MAG TPA: OB-fold domain-containing protein [Streptosporangiaceae bacterium]
MTSPAVAYREHLDRGELAYQACDACGRAVFYPRVLCPDCGSTQLTWRTSAGLGTVYATTALHPRDKDAYNVALVDLDEGFRMMSRVEELPAPDVRIGLRVRAAVVPQDGEPVVVFRPEGTVA